MEKKKLTYVERCEHLDIPDGAEMVRCYGLGLKSITIPDSVWYLDCSDNDLEEIELPENIQMLTIDNNKLKKITCKKELQCLSVLQIRNNNMLDLDIKLPKTMLLFDMEGNPDLRIKYLDFIFLDFDNDESLIDGDFAEFYGDGILNTEHGRLMVANRVYRGQKYIDVSRC